MTTPILFILVPSLMAVMLFFLRKWLKLTEMLSISLYLILGSLAIFQNFGEVLKVGPLSIEIGTTIDLLGRGFTLANADRLFLSIMCITLLLSIGGARQAGVGVHIIPYLMLMVASLTAALAVDPFLYSAIFVEIAVLLSMPVLIHAKEPLSKGVVRFLIFQSLSMPLILLGGWFVAGNQASPSDVQQLGIAGFFLATGFAFWLAVFPFQSWIPQLSEDVHPYISGFILTVFPQAVLLVILDYMNSVTWIRESNYFGVIFISIGSIMIVAAALWGFFEKKVKRIFGYLVLFETGSLLILIGLQTVNTQEAFYLSLIPRLLALLLASFCLSLLIKDENSPNSEVLGSAWRYPFASVGLVVSLFSIIGYPPFGEFPFKFALISSLGVTQQLTAVWIIAGFIGMSIPIFGIIKSLIIPGKQKYVINESLKQILIICIGFFLLLLMGVFPRVLQLVFSHLIQYLS